MTSHYKSKVFDSWGLFLLQDLHADVEDQSPQHTEEMVAEGDGANQLYDMLEQVWGNIPCTMVSSIIEKLRNKVSR